MKGCHNGVPNGLEKSGCPDSLARTLEESDPDKSLLCDALSRYGFPRTPHEAGTCFAANLGAHA